jgi:chemosensory pili system protein ChpA (sensor histidine kinase/response regulator)
MKGAAATVGLKDVGDLAKSLQHKMEDVVDGKRKVNAAFLDELARETRQLIDVAGITGISIGTSAPTAAGSTRAAGSSEQNFFVEEARDICNQAADLVIQLSGPTAAATLVALGRLFHRLKGSALIVGETATATEAARLQHLCEGEDDDGKRVAPANAATVTKGVSKLRELLGLKDERSAPTVTRVMIKLPERELWEAFGTECAELLEQIDRAVIDLERSDQPKQAIEGLLRLYHTLKGSVNTVGLTPSGEYLHRVEDFLESLVEQPIIPSTRLISSFLIDVQNQLRRDLKTADQGSYVETSLARLEARIKKVLASGRTSEPSSSSSMGGLSGSASGSGSMESHTPSSAASRGGSRSRGTDSHLGLVPDEAVRRYVRVPTDRLDALMNLAGELVVGRSRLLSRVTAMKGVEDELGRSRRRLVDTIDRFRARNEFAGIDGRRKKRAAAAAAEEPRKKNGNGASVSGRPAAWSAFGELELDQYDDVHILSRSIAETASDLNEMDSKLFRELASFNEDTDALGKIVSNIQAEVTRARMVPLETVFTRLRLPVRDAAERDQKEVNVNTKGEDVSLDKTIADALFTPMLHLVRNAVGHGIEPPTVRVSKGKPREGTVTLGARQESGQIILEVADDGAGLDLAALHARGVAMGLIPGDTALTDPAVKELVFATGLSTSASAGALSGRGVGCDVVKRAVERMNGDIRVDTVAGRGTTFVITLPLTLAITRAVLVRHEGRNYAVPMYFADRILESSEAVAQSAGRNRIKVNDVFITVRDLHESFGGSPRETIEGSVLVVRVGEQTIALRVDSVVAEEEIVVKNLGRLLDGHPLIAGMTIRGSGELWLILDVPGVIDALLGRTVESRPTSRLGDPVSDEILEEVEAPLTAPEPLRLPEEPAPAAASAANRAVRVLFVDDSLSVRKVAEKTLQELGAEVTLAVDGLDALEKLREGAGKFDLVFSDLEMPRMHGYELIRELRYIPTFQTLPIVVVSSRSGQKHQDQARALGANDYVTKPFTADQLQHMLTVWAGKK